MLIPYPKPNNRLNDHSMKWTHERAAERFTVERWQQGEVAGLGSVETHGEATDKYELSHFAFDDPQRFLSLVQHLSPRDAEIMLCFAVLQMRPTDISTLVGKAGHRAEEDIHKAAHKLAGLVAFGVSPKTTTIDPILRAQSVDRFGSHHLSTCLRQYANCRDFSQLSKQLGQRGLRQQMLRTFKILHRSDDREAGLLAGWLLWLVDGSDPNNKGWRKRRRDGRNYKIGPTHFSSTRAIAAPEQAMDLLHPRATGRGGRAQRADVVKITRQMKFMLRG